MIFVYFKLKIIEIMIKFILDFLIFPFKKNKENNKFNELIVFLFRKYPAYLWKNISFSKILWKIIALPIFILYIIFKK
ncbi:hypothetical protein VAMP_13n207 [Candidatus Vampirococcus lugosii]|uniref:Uncharacterized protein n=1 Tax=Candidatus Vampirococcus lugosii TaxID=2789015 RepID=A0ABS5QK96_9BACT|nr:hypothetical protein [Candidatus Vampirococcus lugosii]